jgi:AbiU2
MAETKEAAAAYAEIMAKMPQPLADMYWRFSNQYCWALVKCQEFEELFQTPQQVDLLNRAAPAFFASLQTILFLDLVMDVGRFTDPAEIGSFRNLSLAQLENAVPDDGVRVVLAARRAAAEVKCKSVRDYRNKVPAHFDMDIALGVKREPPVCRRDLRESLESIASFLNEIERHYGIGPCAYEHTIGPLGGVAVLVRRLEQGLEMERRDRARLRSDPEDR